MDFIGGNGDVRKKEKLTTNAIHDGSPPTGKGAGCQAGLEPPDGLEVCGRVRQAPQGGARGEARCPLETVLSQCLRHAQAPSTGRWPQLQLSDGFQSTGGQVFSYMGSGQLPGPGRGGTGPDTAWGH